MAPPMKCDFCGLPNPDVLVAYRVTVGTPWAACSECHLLIAGGHFLALVSRVVVAFVERTPRAAGQPTILDLDELRRQTETWLYEQFWTRRNGITYSLRRAGAEVTRICRNCEAEIPSQADPCPSCGYPA